MKDTSPDVVPRVVSDVLRTSSGPHDAEVVIVGEAWGGNEAVARSPFIGASGQELNRMLREAGLRRESILCLNVIPKQPPANDFTHFLYDNKEAKALRSPEFHGTYPRPELADSITRLLITLDHLRPKLIIAVGNWALHVLTPHANCTTSGGFKLPTGIQSWRGSQTFTRAFPSGRKYPCLPIIHPASILRDWGWRSLTVHDLRARAKRFVSGERPDWNPPKLNSHYLPNFDVADKILNTWIARASCGPPLRLASDIETWPVNRLFHGTKLITCVGICDEHLELCIPFFHFDPSGKIINHFTQEQELYLWIRIKTLLEHPNVFLIGQNFMYDSLFMNRYYNLLPRLSFDTMVGHHLVFPGTPKGLHVLASMYCDHFCYWKDEGQGWQEDSVSAENLWLYNCKDLRATFEVASELERLHVHYKKVEQYKWRMREWHLARSMALKGINYDNSLRLNFQRVLHHQSEALSEWLLAVVPEVARRTAAGGCWFDSPMATMDLLYTRLGLTPILHKKTKRPTSDDSAIEELLQRKECEWLRPVLERVRAIRSIGVFNSHFLDIRLGANGRLYLQFNIDRPETFRWSSSSNPFDEGLNGQNIPKVEVD